MNCRSLSLGVLLFGFTSLIHAAESPTSAAADRDWKTYQAIGAEPSATPYSEMTERQRAEQVEKEFQQRRELGMAFLGKHPADPRRWEIIADFSPRYPRFIRDWRDLTNAVVDVAAATAWADQVAGWQSQLLSAPGVPAELVNRVKFTRASVPFHNAEETLAKGGRVDLSQLYTRLKEFADENPTLQEASYLASYFSWLGDTQEPGRMPADWASLARSANTNLADLARRKVAFFDLIRKPVELKFTALDGRSIDLTQLRGKVVLLDFWATWCGPCVEELPRVKKLYETYQNQGFEVIGISLDGEYIAPEVSKEERAVAEKRARQKLTDFLEKRGLKWPQCFDLAGPEGSVPTRFAVLGIPWILLLDQEGKVAWRGYEGGALEEEVRKLLKL